MKIAYVRVSSADQNEARQVEALKKYDIEKISYLPYRNSGGSIPNFV